MTVCFSLLTRRGIILSWHCVLLGACIVLIPSGVLEVYGTLERVPVQEYHI